mgnify:FL=1
MYKVIEDYADSISEFLVIHLESNKSSLQLYNMWASKEPTTPNLEIAVT